MSATPPVIQFLIGIVGAACLLAAASALVRYAIKVEPKEFDVKVYAVMFGVTVLLLATLFFMWRV